MCNSASHPRRYFVFLVAFLSLVLAALFCGRAAADSLTVEVDRDRITLNETLSLVVRYEGRQMNSDPDFSGLSQFEILSNHKSTQHSIINGTISASTEWRLALAPRNPGQLLIPPISLAGEHSKALTITVTEASRDPIGDAEDVFLETYLDKASVYVHEQFIITYRLHFNQSVDSLDTGQFGIDQARVEELPRVDFQKTIGHTHYGVAEFRYAVFPDASGTIRVPAQTWTVRTTDQPGMGRFGFGGGRFKLHRVRTKPLDVTVTPKPDAFPAHLPWLPAQSLKLTEQWSRSPEEFRVGEPITRTVTITAEGVGPEQLPPLFDESGSADLKFYPDKPHQDKQLSAQGVTGVRTESVAIVPNRAGAVLLPEVTVTWWNSAERKVEKAVLPARTLQVTGANPVAPEPTAAAPAVPGPDTAAATPSTTTAGWWPILSLILTLSNLVVLLLWWRAARRTRSAVAAPPDRRVGLAEIKEACQRRDARALRQALLRWARRCWPGQPATLADIGRLSGDLTFARELAKLDEQLYGGAAVEVDYGIVGRGMAQLDRMGTGAAPSTALSTALSTAPSTALPPLYKVT